jgi:hypothetical protein
VTSDASRDDQVKAAHCPCSTEAGFDAREVVGGEVFEQPASNKQMTTAYLMIFSFHWRLGSETLGC